jgi:hypothetical protein
VGFAYAWGEAAHSFDVAERSLGEAAAELASARTQGVPGVEVEDWLDGYRPKLNGQALVLKQYERSRSLAIGADGQRFALGSEWNLRLYDRVGTLLWRQAAPGVAWTVNISADNRFVVSGFGDGTIRWYRMEDGQEVLALFAHADRQRWIMWTPEGFYDASPDAEELIGYHLNRGKDQAGEFVSARQLREQFYQPGLIARRLDQDGDQLIAEAVRELGDVRELLAGSAARTPVVELLSPDRVSEEEEVTVTFRVKDRGGGVGNVVFYVDGQEYGGRQASVFADETISRTIPLPPGRELRSIEIAATNRAGVEGKRAQVRAMLTGPQRDSALYIFAVGVERYDDRLLPELKYSHDDAEDLSSMMTELAKPLFKRGVFPVVLRDPSLSEIEAEFTTLRKRIRPQDTLVIFLAGHGEAPIGKGYTFLPADFSRGAPGEAGEGLSEARLRRILERSPLRTLLLVDTCDAGGAVDLVASQYERLGGVSRHAIIGASRRGEFAKEGYQGHGVFTAALLATFQSEPEFEDQREMGIQELRWRVKNHLRHIMTRMPGHYSQRTSGFVGSKDFYLIAR